MKENIHKVAKGILTLLPIALAFGVVAYLVTHRSGPTERQDAELVRTLRVIETPAVDLVPQAMGYGVAEPGWVWEVVAEVKGTVSSIHPRLKSGEMIGAKTVLIQIDPTEYELAVARLEASVQENQAKIKELTETEENTKRLVTVEQKSLELARTLFERKRVALERDAISQDDVDREERNLLQQTLTVQHLQNTLALIPSKQKALESALSVQQSHLKQARIDLAKTVITSPYDCRLGDVSIDAGQFVRAGQSLFNAHSTAVAVVEARFRLEALRPLLSEQRRQQFQPGLSTGAFKQLFDDVRVLVSLQSGDWSVQWDAKIDRFRETVDAKTREIKVVVSVDRPYEKAVPGVRPPLTAGMFCRVELHAPARAGSLVIPRSAIHDSHVFVIDQEHRLQKKPVVVDFVQAECVVLKSGLSRGEMLVVSDPAPAITGMKVAPLADDHLKQYLVNSSQAEVAKQ